MNLRKFRSLRLYGKSLYGKTRLGVLEGKLKCIAGFITGFIPKEGIDSKTDNLTTATMLEMFLVLFLSRYSLMTVQQKSMTVLEFKWFTSR